MNIELKKNNIVLLCCGKAKCPSVAKDGKFYLIKDDFGNEIKLEKRHLKAIPDALDALSKDG